MDRVNHYYPFGLEFGGDLNITGTISPNYKYSSQGQEKQLETGWSSYRWRNYDAAMGRFFSIDPLSEKYAYQSHYNFSENRVVDGRELEGLEWIGIATRFMPLFEGGSNVRPSPVVEIVTKTGETTGKISRNSEALSRGRQTEKEQLEKMGLDKNNRTFDFTDPKTGSSGRTIPDAINKNGDLIEIKHVAKQSLTKQLRGQLEIAKKGGVDAILKINDKAEVSNPLKNSGIKIQRFTPGKTDNIKVNPAPPALLFPKPQKVDWCKNNPKCA